MPIDYIKAPFRSFKRRVWEVGPMAANPYATHIPILVACAHLFRPRRILELGSGFYSTPLFLDKDIFPDAMHVCSLENDPEWFQQLNRLADPRLERLLIEGPMCAAIRAFDCSQYDLVFVDDSTHARHRRKTLRALRNALGSQIVVVHDVDQWRIRLGIYSFPNHYEMLALTPQTSIAWHTRQVSRGILTEVDQIILGCRHQISVDEPLEWRKMFDQLPTQP